MRAALDASAPLRELLPDVVDEMFARMVERRYDAQERMIRQGDPGDCMLVVVEGSARVVFRNPGGDAEEIARLSAGDIAGEMALVTHEPRSADVVASSPVIALALAVDDFHRLAGRHLELGMVLTRLVGERLGHAVHDGAGSKVVHGYRILRRIGSGGMSIVYEAEREETGEHVALKMMSHRLAYETGAMTRFVREADIVSSFEHENIALVHEHFRAYRTEFLVMELCDGPNLEELVRRRGALPEEPVRRVIGQVARALSYVHARGVIHRDVKPSNVMLDSNGRAKLMDFGVARQGRRAKGLSDTADYAVLGTPTYMPPEQLIGSHVDERADYYALACLGYELLTGRPPFVSTELFELSQEKLAFRVPAASAIGRGVSREMRAFLKECLREDPAERPDSIERVGAWAAPVML